MSQYKCHECGWEGPANDLGAIEDFDQRVCTGEIMPAGQCPECHALVDATDDDVIANAWPALHAIMQRRGWTLTPPEEKMYRVEWVIEVPAVSPEDAARKAQAIQRDPDSIATVFDVREQSATCTVDLWP